MTALPSTTAFEDYEVSVGKLIQKRRDALGLNQKETADRSDISLSALKQYETDRLLPPLDKAIRLADVLKIDPRVFFDELGIPKSEEVNSANRPADAQLVKVLTELSSAVGAKISFDHNDQDAQVYEGNLFCDELGKLQNLVDWKGLHSRHLPAAISDAEAALWNLDMDEVEMAALDVGIPADRLLGAKEALALLPEQRDERCKHLIPRILSSAVYGAVLEYLQKDDLQWMADDIADQCFNSKKEIKTQGWVTESDQAYLTRLRFQLADLLKKSIIFGRPYSMPEHIQTKFQELVTEIEDMEINEDLNEGNEQ